MENVNVKFSSLTASMRNVRPTVLSLIVPGGAMNVIDALVFLTPLGSSIHLSSFMIGFMPPV